jgi:RNA polymerase-binding transcription factor DksA
MTLTSLHPDLSSDELDAIRKTTLVKLGKVSADLEELLAKQNHRLGQDMEPSYRKIIRLRELKNVLNDTLKKIVAGEYGLCLKCEEPIRAIELKEMPWADTCSGCAGA